MAPRILAATVKNEPTTYKCRSCKKESPDSASLAAHIKSSSCLFRSLIRVPVVYVSRLKTYLCSSCGLMLYSKEQFEPHFKLFHCKMAAEVFGKSEAKAEINNHEQIINQYSEVSSSKLMPSFDQKDLIKMFPEILHPVSAKPICTNISKTTSIQSDDVPVTPKKTKKKRSQNDNFLNSTEIKKRTVYRLRKQAAQEKKALVSKTIMTETINTPILLSAASEVSELSELENEPLELEAEAIDLFDVIEIID